MAKKRAKKIKRQVRKKVKRPIKKHAKKHFNKADISKKLRQKAGINFTLLKIIGTLALLLIAFLLIINANKSPTGNTIINPPIPSTCSDDSIKAVWDSIFKESSTDINVSANSSQTSRCNAFTAFKIKNNRELYLLIGRDINFFGTNLTTYGAQYMLFNLNYLNPADFSISQINITHITPRNIAISAAPAEFSNYFKAVPTTWHTNITLNGTRYIFEDSFFLGNIDLFNFNISQIGGVEANLTSNFFMFMSFVYPNQYSNCASNWIALNANCSSNERMTTYYRDVNNCTNAPPSNITHYCDYDRNGLIGNFSAATMRRVSADISINGNPINLSSNYSSLQRVELKSGNITVVGFNWNFVASALNLENITIEKESINSAKGYLIVEGINATKEITINRLNPSSNSVCVKDSAVESIDEISSSCSLINEYIVPCPGSNLSYTCNISDSTHLKITGLKHSAVSEMTVNQSSSSCIPLTCSALSKECGIWTETNCNASLECGECNSGYECTSGTCTVLCAPKWNCTKWMPEKCPKNLTQTRLCQDTNACGASFSNTKPKESQACEYKSSTGKIILIIILVILLLAMIGIAAGYFLKKKTGLSSAAMPTIRPPGNPPSQTPEQPTPIIPSVPQQEPIPPISSEIPTNPAPQVNQPPTNPTSNQ